MRLSPFAPETDSAFKKSKKKNAYDLCKTVSIFPIIYIKKKKNISMNMQGILLQ